MNSFYADSVYAYDDSVFTVETTYTFEVNSNDEILNGDIVTNFTTQYNAISTTLSNNPSYTFEIMDVKFVDYTGNGEVTLKFLCSYLVNASNSISSFGWPNIVPASLSRYGGANARCSSINPWGAANHVRRQVRQTLPNLIYTSPARANVVQFYSEPGNINVFKVTREWLYAQINPLVVAHQGSQPILTCVSPTEQDTYAQHMSDYLYDIVSNRNYWDGVSGLVIDFYPATGSSTSDWDYEGKLHQNVYANNQVLSPSVLGL